MATRGPCPQPPPAPTVPLPPPPSHVPSGPQAGTSLYETPTPATCSLGHTDTDVHPKYATSLWLSEPRVMGHMGEWLLEMQRCSWLLLVLAALEKWLPQLTGEQRSILLQTKERAPHGHTPASCGSWSRVNIQNLSPNPCAIAGGRRGTSESSHPQRELLFACTRWAERGVEGWGGEATNACAPGGHHPVKQNFVPSVWHR